MKLRQTLLSLYNAPVHNLNLTIYSLYWAGTHDCHVRLVEYNCTETLILNLKKEDVGFFFYKKAKTKQNKTKKRKKTEKNGVKIMALTGHVVWQKFMGRGQERVTKPIIFTDFSYLTIFFYFFFYSRFYEWFSVIPSFRIWSDFPSFRLLGFGAIFRHSVF